MSHAQEQRLTARLLEYWESIRKDRRIPRIEHFNTAMVSDLWPGCMQLGLEPDKGLRYRCDYMGKMVQEIYGEDLSGTPITRHTKRFPGEVMISNLNAMT